MRVVLPSSRSAERAATLLEPVEPVAGRVLAIEPASEREAWLEALPADDADLAPFLCKALTDDVPVIVSSPALTGPPEERAGDEVGPYRLVR